MQFMYFDPTQRHLECQLIAIELENKAHDLWTLYVAN